MALAWLIQESPLGSSEQVRSDLKLQRSQRASQRAFSLRILSLTNSIGFESREHAQGIPTVNSTLYSRNSYGPRRSCTVRVSTD